MLTDTTGDTSLLNAASTIEISYLVQLLGNVFSMQRSCFGLFTGRPGGLVSFPRILLTTLVRH